MMRQNSSESTPAASAGVRRLTIDADQAGQRLDNYLSSRMKGVPKSRLYRLVRKGEVRVNGKRAKPDTRLENGDLVRIPPVRVRESAPEPNVPDKLAQKLEQAILLETPALLVLNKPSGLAVHGGSGINLGVIEALRKIRPDVPGLELVHRLDRDTSGCLVVAKKRSMLRHLHAQFRDDKVQKTYQALVAGRWPARRQSVAAPLKKNELKSGERVVRVSQDGKASLTNYKVESRFGDITLVQAMPKTGRTHQIRVHCQYAGHPIMGDPKYGDDRSEQQTKDAGLKRLFLHAARLEFALPDGEEVVVNAPLAPELKTVLKGLAQRRSDNGQNS
ncbi:23S rRNA pseudouridine(955/2504/2580) synthase RluC [Spongorhabdus nitratireducens]